MGIKLTINTRQSDNIKTVQQIDKFNSVKLHLQYDSIASTFEFDLSFDPTDRRQAEIVSVSHMHECSIYYVHARSGNHKDTNYRDVYTTDELTITGFLLSQGFYRSVKPKPVKVGGYSKSGALEDSDISIDKYPLESNGKTFKQIVTSILTPSPGQKGFNFGFKISPISQGTGVVFAEAQSADESYDKSTAPESKTIKAYFTELASQKNIVLSHTPQGDLLITSANINGKSILDVTKIGVNGVMGYEVVYNGQGLHSQITVIRQADEDNGNAAEYTIYNPLVPIVYRPRVVSLTSGNDISIQKAARNELGNELKAISLKVELDRGSINSKFIFPNQILTITDPEVFLYPKTRWLIESVDFEQDAQGEKMTLNCVLPSVYGGPVTNPFVDVDHNLPIL